MYFCWYCFVICLIGEVSYVIVNFIVVVEFFEYVNLFELGLGSDLDKVMSIEDLLFIRLDYMGMDGGNGDVESIVNVFIKFWGWVGEFVGLVVGFVNKVISGVVDILWLVFWGFMGNFNVGVFDGDE